MPSLQPVDWFSLAILFQIKAIHQNIQQSEGNKHNNYSILQSLLVLVTHLIFNKYQLQLNSIADIYQIIQDNLQQVPQVALNQIIRSINHSLQFAFEGSADGLYQFSVQLHILISSASNSQLDRPTNFHPDSPIGLYVRSCRLDISTLEFDHLSAIAAQLKSFFNPSSLEHTPPPLPSTSSLSCHQPYIDPTLEAYLDFTDSYAPDYNKASNSLRRFYDIRSINDNHRSNSANQPGSNRQQALLSLSKLYLLSEAYPTALDALEEAARLARLANDQTILDQCASLERRIIHFSGFEASSKIEENGTIKDGDGGLTGPVQAQARLQSLRNLGHSHDDKKHNTASNGAKSKLDGTSNNEWSSWDCNEEIFLVFKSIFIGAEPINHLHARLFWANRMKIMNNSSDSDSGVERASHSTPFDQISWFALQAKIWDLQGQVGLCEIYEDLALESLEVFNPVEQNSFQEDLKLISKSDVVCHRALRLAKNGQLYEALLLICQLLIDSQSDAKSFRYIHQTVFEIFEFKAKHEGNEALIESLKMFRFHSSPPPNSKSISVQKQIEDLFKQAETFMDQGNHHAALCPTVSAIVQSDRMNLKNHQSKGIVLWANIILHLHPPSTEDLTDDNDKDQVSFSHSSNQVLQEIQSTLDLPGLQSNSLLKIHLFWTLVRLKIHHLVSYASTGFDCLSNHTYEVLDLLRYIDILYQKVDDSKGRKKVVGYELIIIEETKHQFTSKQLDKSKEAFLFKKLNELEQDAKKRWIQICTSETLFDNFLKPIQINSVNAGFFNDPLSNLFAVVRNLVTLSSVHRYI